MKTATIVFLALTVFSGLFLETSTAPSFLTDNVTGNKQIGILGPIGDLVGGIVDNVADLLKKLLAGVDSKVKNELTPLFSNLEELKNLLQQLEAAKDLNIEEIEKIIDTLFKLLNKNNKALNDALEKFGNDLNIKSILDKLAKLVDDVITKVIKKLEALLSKLLDDIANNLVPKLKKLATSLLKRLKEALADGNEDVKEIIEVEELLNKLNEILDKIIEAFQDPIDTGLLYKVGPLLAEVKSIIAKLKQVVDLGNLSDDIKDLLTGLVKVAEGILAKVAGIIKVVKNLLSIGIGKIRSEVKALLDGLPTGIDTEELIKALFEFLNEVESGNDIIAASKKLEVLCTIVKKIKALVAKILDNLDEELLGKVLKVVGKVLEKVRNVLKPIFKELVKIIKELASKLKEGLANILQKIREALADAKEEHKELLNKLLELVKKLIEKILDLIKALLAALSNVTNDSLNAVDKLIKEVGAILDDLKLLLSSLGEDNLLNLKVLISSVVDIAEEVLTNIKIVRCSLVA